MSLIETAYVAELDRTVNALQSGGGVVLVHGAESQAAIELSEVALSRLPQDHALALVDIGRCQDDLALARALALAVGSTYVGAIPAEAFLSGQWRSQRNADLLALIETTSPRFYAVLRDVQAVSDPGELFELSVDAFTRRAADGPVVLIFFGADELRPVTARRSRFAASRDFLWTLRGRLQQSIGDGYVLFAGGEGTAGLVADQDAAFFGWGTEVPIEPLPSDRMRRHLEAELRDGAQRLGLWERSDVDAVALGFVEACRGSALLAQQLLEILPLVALERSKPQGVETHGLAESTIGLLLELNTARLRSQARLVKGLAPDALGIALALARGERPYSVVDHPSAASRALRAMQDHGLVTRDRGAGWTLSDPMFALWLERPSVGRPRTEQGTDKPIPLWEPTI